MIKVAPKTLKKITSVIILLVGVILTGSSELIRISSPSIFWESMLMTLGTTLISLSIISIFIDLESWKQYFGKRITDVIMKQDYLDTLDADNLKQLQVSVLKAQFKNNNIDKEGSFLSYFQNNLHQLISFPYREDVALEIIVTEIADSNSLHVFDKVSYACRAISSEIQEKVRWIPDLEEFEEVESLLIKVKYPYTHKNAGDVVQIFDLNDKKAKEPEYDIFKDGAEISLDDYKAIDGLIVLIESQYKVAMKRFQYWQMAHPTKNFSITIKYPETMIIQHKPLVLHENMCVITQQHGYLKVVYDSWMLPRSGMAWSFTK